MCSFAIGAAGPKPLGHPWRIIAAVCVQRMPVLNREKTELECQYEELRDTMRVESSKLSEFELEELEYMREKRKREKRALEEDLDSAQVKISTASRLDFSVDILQGLIAIAMIFVLCVKQSLLTFWGVVLLGI